MDIDPVFVSDGEATEAVQPPEAAFDHPSMTPELLAGVDAAPSDTWLDPATAAGTSASSMIVGLIGVQLVWPSAWPAAWASNRRNCVEQRLQRHTVVDVGPCQQEDERDAVAVRDKVAFGAGLASIRRVRADGCAPFLAAMEELSMQARRQSMRSAFCRRRSNSRWSRSHTPACCQSRSRRQHVTPEPHPISCGSISQGMPVRSTNRMPVSAMRLLIRGRPPFGLAGSGGSNGSMTSQSASATRGAGIAPHESNPARVQGF